MDALLFTDAWARKGDMDLADEVLAIARDVAPELGKKPWLTMTNWKGANSKLVTPYSNPVVYYQNNGKQVVYDIGEEIEDQPGVFPLTYAEGVPDELRREEPKKSGSDGISSPAKKRRRVADSDS